VVFDPIRVKRLVTLELSKIVVFNFLLLSFYLAPDLLLNKYRLCIELTNIVRVIGFMWPNLSHEVFLVELKFKFTELIVFWLNIGILIWYCTT
jgi:hypothetical protein